MLPLSIQWKIEYTLCILPVYTYIIQREAKKRFIRCSTQNLPQLNKIRIGGNRNVRFGLRSLFGTRVWLWKNTDIRVINRKIAAILVPNFSPGQPLQSYFKSVPSPSSSVFCRHQKLKHWLSIFLLGPFPYFICYRLASLAAILFILLLKSTHIPPEKKYNHHHHVPEETFSSK
jgi:hypothetical protein